VKMRKARSGFITNLFGCAGFEVEIAETVTGDPDVIVLCSSDAEYAGLAPRVIKSCAMRAITPVIVAGNPADSMEQLKQAAWRISCMPAAMRRSLRGWQERLG